ncbi:MAG: RNA-directed DNA polymerase [Bacteroidetes bacterium]|nr:MAG: RNA-directed DNA polymerase [Bacteroidota bacterium]
MANQNDSENWREELKRLGKEYFIIQEMLRTGFLKLTPEDIALYKTKIKELNDVNGEIYRLSHELRGIEDITPLIEEIRKNRIARVKAERIIKKAERAKTLEEHKRTISEKQKSKPNFLGEKFASKLKFEGGDAGKLQASGLPTLNDLHDLSQATGISRERLQWLCYHRQAATIDHYTRFQIPKRKGGMRSISSPKPQMRLAQSWVLDNILSKLPIHDSAVAFREGKSIVDNANFHAGNALLVRLDLKDFFPSVRFHRIKGLFTSFGYNYGIATVFALLCTDAARIGAKLNDKQYFVALGDRYLPQGACTSPMLTNLICRGLDNRLTKLCASLGWRYTRYADDLVFSHEDEQADLKKLLGLVKKIIKEETFEVNEEKTLVMRPHQRQTVTGIVINDGKLRLSRRDVRNFRAFLHQYTLKGAEAMSQRLGKDATQYAKGYLAFMRMVNPEQADKFVQEYAWLA